VAVLPEVAPSEVTIRDEDLEWSFMRAGGAGGQSVNKTNSAVRLVHTPSGIVVNARQERKQVQNRQIALELLRSQLWEIEEEKRQLELGTARSAIGRARRAEKIRTYNYPQNRITDHRTKQSWHNLPVMLDGGIETMLLELRAALLAGDVSPEIVDDTAEMQQ
jgi:peptide chain release factor 1